MRISEIARKQPTLETRRVGIRTDHIYIVETAIRIYTTLGLDPTIEYDNLYLNTPKHRALWTMGAIERATGKPAYNDWDRQ